MNYHRLKAISLFTLLVMAMLPSAAVQATPLHQEPGTNLLVNPGFEGIGRPLNNSTPNYNNWTRDTFNGVPYGEIFTPEGWVTWWQEGEFKRPECKVIPNEPPFNGNPEKGEPKRIYEGYYSGLCFTFYGKQNAGYYQVVRNLPPGSIVEGSFYAHAWACGDDEHQARSCSDPYAFYFRVGIDPNGGTDPFSPNVVWSQPYYYYDNFGRVGPVQATVGEAGVVTFFMQAYAKWQLKHNDAYWDNASLVLVTPGDTPTPTSPPPPPTSALPPTPQYTPTPLPDGTIVHIVQPGDTLFGIALTYGVDLDELRRLNAGSLGPNDLLSIGQKIVVAVSPNAVSATPTPVPPVETQLPPQPTQQPAPGDETPANTPAPAGGAASICVLAFHDRNNDMFRQPDAEEMLPNAQFSLTGASGPVGTYTSDGISEPYCFTNLQPGTYVLRHTPPPGYQLTDAGQWNIVLGAGQQYAIEIGYLRGQQTTTPQTPAALAGTANPTAPSAQPVQPHEGETDQETGGMIKTLITITRVSGIIALVLAVIAAAFFFLSKRTF